MPMVTGRILDVDGNSPGATPVYVAALFQGTTKRYGGVTIDSDGDYVFPSVLAGTYNLKAKLSTAPDTSYVDMTPVKSVIVSAAPVIANARVNGLWVAGSGAGEAEADVTWYFCSNPGDIDISQHGNLGAFLDALESDPANNWRWMCYPAIAGSNKRLTTIMYPSEVLLVRSKDGTMPGDGGIGLKWDVCK